MYTLLRAAVPVRFVTAGCKPAKRERHTKSTNVYAERLSLLMIFICIFCGPHLPKVGTWQFLNVLKCKSSSRYSLVQMLPAWSSKSAPRLSLFLSVLKTLSLRYSPVCFLSTTFAARAPHSRKQRPYFGNPRSHITVLVPYLKFNTGFCAENVFTCEFTRFRTLTLLIYLMMVDGVVDMTASMTIVQLNFPLISRRLLIIFPCFLYFARFPSFHVFFYWSELP